MNNHIEKILLSQEQIRALKKSAHHLKPVVQLGKKGISAGLIQEINQALSDHELIKLQISPQQKINIDDDLIHLIEETKAHHIATIGHVLILFRKHLNREGKYGCVVSCS